MQRLEREFHHVVAVTGVLLRFLVVWPIAVKPQKQGLYGLYQIIIKKYRLFYPSFM